MKNKSPHLSLNHSEFIISLLLVECSIESSAEYDAVMNLNLGFFIQAHTGNITVTRSDFVERNGILITISFVLGLLAIILSASSCKISQRYL